MKIKDIKLPRSLFLCYYMEKHKDEAFTSKELNEICIKQGYRVDCGDNNTILKHLNTKYTSTIKVGSIKYYGYPTAIAQVEENLIKAKRKLQRKEISI